MAEASLFVHSLEQKSFLENTNVMLSHINVGSGTDVTIRELAETVKDIVDFKGELVFDRTKPDGVQRKLMNVTLLSKLGWKAQVSLQSGLKRSYTDFLSTL